MMGSREQVGKDTRSADRAERFRPTSGRLTGGFGLATAAAVALSGFADEDLAFPVPARMAALVVGVLIWAAALRPRVELAGPDLVLRNMLDTTHIPLAAIEEIITRQMFIVWVGPTKYTSPALNRSTLQLRSAGANLGAGVPRVNYVDYVEDKIRVAMAAERVRRGVSPVSPEQKALGAEVRRTLAWPEIVALAVTGLAFVVSLFL